MKQISARRKSNKNWTGRVCPLNINEDFVLWRFPDATNAFESNFCHILLIWETCWAWEYNYSTMKMAYTTVEVFRNVYIVRNNIARVDMSQKRHIVCVQNTNTQGEIHVGNIEPHLGNSRPKLQNINARFVDMFHSVRRMVSYICEAICTHNLQRSQSAMGNTQTESPMRI